MMVIIASRLWVKYRLMVVGCIRSHSSSSCCCSSTWFEDMVVDIIAPGRLLAQLHSLRPLTVCIKEAVRKSDATS